MYVVICSQVKYLSRDILCARYEIPIYDSVFLKIVAQNNMASTSSSRTGSNTPFFAGERRFLGNFFYSPIQYDNYVYKTAEHAFQAAKTFNEAEKTKIKLSATPNVAKKLGRRVTLRADWEDIKYNIMEEIVRAKFQQNYKLMQKLVLIPDKELCEWNKHHDNIWGICVCSRCKGNKGRNWLGKILRVVKNENST